MYKSIIVVVVGMVMLGSAVASAIATRAFLQSSVVVPGRVVALNAGGSHPQIEFVMQSGEHISYAQGGMVFGVKLGESVHVRYSPQAVRETATLDRFGALWGRSLFLAIMGCGFIVAGTLKLSSRRSYKRK